MFYTIETSNYQVCLCFNHRNKQLSGLFDPIILNWWLLFGLKSLVSLFSKIKRKLSISVFRFWLRTATCWTSCAPRRRPGSRTRGWRSSATASSSDASSASLPSRRDGPCMLRSAPSLFLCFFVSLFLCFYPSYLFISVHIYLSVYPSNSSICLYINSSITLKWLVTKKLNFKYSRIVDINTRLFLLCMYLQNKTTLLVHHFD